MAGVGLVVVSPRGRVPPGWMDHLVGRSSCGDRLSGGAPLRRRSPSGRVWRASYREPRFRLAGWRSLPCEMGGLIPEESPFVPDSGKPLSFGRMGGLCPSRSAVETEVEPEAETYVKRELGNLPSLADIPHEFVPFLAP
jgi:hypothetical protein